MARSANDDKNRAGDSEIGEMVEEKKDNLKFELPFISALLVTKDEQDYVEMALTSLIDQTYPKSRYEIIVIDGGSTDDTLKIVERIKKECETAEFSITVYDNRKKILAAGWNIGIKAAKGDYVIRIDAHAKAEPDFLMESMKTMMKVEAVCVGGKLETKTLTGNNDAISKVLSSPFGVGNSRFRVSDKEGYADTAVYGLYNKKVFEEVGYFSEKYDRNQDLQMHSRIKKNGGRFYFNPQIKCAYYARNTTKKMAKQAFQNGIWNMVLLKEDKSALSLRHMIPFTFVLFLGIAGIGGIFNKTLRKMGLFVVAFHLAMGFAFGIKSGARGKETAKMPFLFFLLHSAYGAGFFSGAFK